MKIFKNLKKENGSITLFVLIACMFMIMILLIVNIGVINKNRNQEKELEEISKQYNQNETDLNNEYRKIADDNGYLTKQEIKELIKETKLEMYPIGSIYISTNEQNPSEYIGGEWESYGEGRTIVGAGTGADTNNVQKVFAINQTGGEYEHVLLTREMPSHEHSMSSKTLAGSMYGYPTTSGNTTSSIGTIYTDSTGESQPHNNIQPYIVSYMWKRTK